VEGVMIDVFLRSMAGTGIRHWFFNATVERWRMEDVRLMFLWDKGIREGRMEAEARAESDPYIYSDDDVLPFGKDWLAKGTRILLDHPEFAIASTRSVIKEEMLNLSHEQESAEIFEVRCVGAPMWIRKGILKDLPEFSFREECIVIDNYVRQKGYKEGIINGIWHHHLGFGCATDPSLVRCW
jgi:hypothetical protein